MMACADDPVKKLHHLLHRGDLLMGLYNMAT
jgi:hypothetical protein